MNIDEYLGLLHDHGNSETTLYVQAGFNRFRVTTAELNKDENTLTFSIELDADTPPVEMFDGDPEIA